VHPITIFVLFCALGRFAQGVSATAYVPFLMAPEAHGGLSLTPADVGLLEAAYSLSIFAFELPTGMLADGKSRAWSLRVGCIIWAASVLAYGLCIGFWTALLAEIGIGIGNAFISGAQEAWVVDAIKRRHEKDGPDVQQTLVRTAFSRQGTWTHVAYFVGGITGAGLYGWNARVQWLIAGVACALTFVLAKWFMKGLGEPFERKNEWQAFRASLSALNERPELRWALASVMLFSLLIPLQLMWAPWFEHQKGMGLVGTLWPVSCGMLILGAWLVRTKHAAEGRERRVIVFALACGAVALIALPRLPLAGQIIAVMVWRFGNGLHGPSVSTYVQQRIGSSYRATFGSLQSFLGRGMSAVVLGGMWIVAVGKGSDNATIGLVLTCCGFALAAGVLLLAVIRPRAPVPQPVTS
jgi:MFS family permease